MLDYFKHSPFYSFTCNNEAVLSSGGPSQLRSMEGVEFEVAESPSAPSQATSDSAYFLIRKQWRSSPTVTYLLQLYYVVGVESTAASSSTSLPRGSVVPLPSFSAVARCALESALTSLNSAMLALIQTSKGGLGGEEGGEEGLRADASSGEVGVERSQGDVGMDEEEEDEDAEWEEGGEAEGVVGVSAGSPSPPTVRAPLLTLADESLRRLLAPPQTEGRGRG